MARLTKLRDDAANEGRDLSDAEKAEVEVLRVQIDSATLAASSDKDDRIPVAPTNPERAVTNGMTIQRADHQPTLNDEVRRVAESIVESYRNGQMITRALLSLPAGFQAGNGVAGDPTDVIDLGSVFGARELESQTVQSVVYDATDGVEVAEGAPKPDILTAELVTDTAVKIAGMGTTTLETLTFVDSAQRVLLDVIRQAIISGVNGNIVAALEADGTALPFDTSGLKTLLKATATVNTKSNANVALVSAGDWVDLTLALASLPQSVQLPRLIVEPHVTAGQAVVAATSAVDVARSQVIVLLDPYTLAHENKVRIIAEQFVALNVVRPELVQIADVVTP